MEDVSRQEERQRQLPLQVPPSWELLINFQGIPKKTLGRRSRERLKEDLNSPEAPCSKQLFKRGLAVYV
jgi:hypothetical protein